MSKRPLKVLLVEDELLIAKSMQYDIEDLGAEVLGPVARGDDAINTALQGQPDLILMDIQLKGNINGIEAAEKIAETKNIPLAFISGYASKYIKEQAQKVNPVAFLEKPVSINKIKEIVDKLRE